MKDVNQRKENIRGIYVAIPDNYNVVHDKFDTVQNNDKRYVYAMSGFAEMPKKALGQPIHKFMCVVRPEPSKIGWNIRSILSNIKERQSHD